MNRLHDTFYTMPNIANQTMTSKELKELLLDTSGKIFSCGRLRTIKSKHLGAGVYRITLEVKDDNEEDYKPPLYHHKHKYGGKG